MTGVLRFVRDNEVKMTIPAVSLEIRKDGTVWQKNGTPILGITDPIEKERVVKLMKSKEFDKIPAEHFVRLGDNANGVSLLTEEAWGSHPAKLKADQKAAEKAAEQAKRVTIYLSSRGWGDYSPVEWFGDITRPDSEIMAECQLVLKNGYDVDNPKQTDEEILHKISEARKYWAGKEEREKKQAEEEKVYIANLIETGYCFNCESYCFGDCGHYSKDPMTRYKRVLRERSLKTLNIDIKK